MLQQTETADLLALPLPLAGKIVFSESRIPHALAAMKDILVYIILFCLITRFAQAGPVQASIIPKEKPSGRRGASGLVIPEKFSNRVKKIGADLYRVGDVTIDSKLQAAAFPAKVNQIIGLIEYALVTEQGKTHESFLSTKIKPGDLHVAILLLGVKPPVNVSVEIAWQEDGKWTRKSITNCIAQYPLEVASEQENKETQESFELKPSSWTWTGSRVRSSGILAADELGSILSLQPDPDALSLIDPMIDTSRFGSHVWSKQVPKKDSMVQIFIRPFQTEKNAKP